MSPRTEVCPLCSSLMLSVPEICKLFHDDLFSFVLEKLLCSNPLLQEISTKVLPPGFPESATPSVIRRDVEW